MEIENSCLRLPSVIFNPFYRFFVRNLLQYGADGCVRRKDKMMTIVEAGTLLSRVRLPLNSGGLDIGQVGLRWFVYWRSTHLSERKT